jgi:hypothetical protein
VKGVAQFLDEVGPAHQEFRGVAPQQEVEGLQSG